MAKKFDWGAKREAQVKAIAAQIPKGESGTRAFLAAKALGASNKTAELVSKQFGSPAVQKMRATFAERASAGAYKSKGFGDVRVSSDARGKDPATTIVTSGKTVEPPAASAAKGYGTNYNIPLKKSAVSSWESAEQTRREIAKAAGVDVDSVDIDTDSGTASLYMDDGGTHAAAKSLKSVPGVKSVYADAMDERGNIVPKQSSVAAGGKPVGNVGTKKVSVKTGKASGGGGADDQPRVPAGSPDGGQWT